AAGLRLPLLGGLSWAAPPWSWGIPFVVAVIWTYVGGGFFLLGLLYDRAYRWIWGIELLVWGGSVHLVWSLFPSASPCLAGVRVGTFNMDAAHYQRARIEKLADSLSRWHPHILCLQEVYLGDYSAKDFALRLGYKHYAFLDAKMQMGMLVLSDFPLEKVHTHVLLSGTTNGLYEVWVQLPWGEKAQIINVHFPSYRLGREKSWNWDWLSQVWSEHARFYEKLEAILRKKVNYRWVCGDFNALPFHPVYRMLRSRLYDSHEAAQWGKGPTWRRLLRIDYIWADQPAVSQSIRWIPGQSHAYVEAAYSWKSATFAMKSGR
ncbi:MAG: endonuclease/exonuclease/phosphatase family protein, partial [Bacteroidia bacterium]|nr:endonuclease/exonuclease/phosphatase family protein [Bacteroidia bacterium]